MKKILVTLIAVSLILLLSACASPSPVSDHSQDSSVIGLSDSASAADPESPDPEDQAVTDERIADEAGYGQIIIKVENTDIEYFYAPDRSGNLILSYICEKPVVEIENNEYASDTINSFFNDLDEEYHTGENRGLGNTLCPGKNQMLQKATDNYQCYVDYEADIRLELVFSHYVDIVRCDNQVISFIFTDYLFDGTGNGEFYKYALSFDSFSGKMVDISDNRVFAEIRKIVNSTVPDYAELSYEKGRCFLDSDGLSFLVRTDSAGEDGSYYKTVTVPYSALGGVDAPFFGEIGRLLPGSVSIFKATADFSDSEIIDRIDVSAEGQQYFLKVEGTVYDFKLLGVQYSNYDEVFYSKNLYWMTNYLSDCMLQLSLVIPEGMPDVMICYSSEGEEYSRFISQSGLTGEVLLVDETINALG